MTQSHIKKEFPRHNTHWSKKEVADLLQYKAEGRHWQNIGNLLQRLPDSCKLKYKALEKKGIVLKTESPVAKATPVIESNFKLNRKVKGITVEVNGISTTIDFDGEYLRIKI